MKGFLAVDQDCKLWVLLSQAAHTALRVREKELSQYGISAIEAAVLFIIQAIGDKATPAEISRWLLRESHSVSGLLNRMEGKGLVSRVKDLERKNLVRVALTEKGKAVYRQSRREKVYPQHLVTAISGRAPATGVVLGENMEQGARRARGRSRATLPKAVMGTLV